MDTSNMQGFGSNSSTVQQSVIQGTTPMSVHQQGSSGTNTLLYSAANYTQDMSQNSQNNQQQMMAMSQNRQQQSNESSSQAMMSDLNPFISGGMTMNQQQSQQANEQMISSSGDTDDKEAYKTKFSRGYSRPQLP